MTEPLGSSSQLVWRCFFFFFEVFESFEFFFSFRVFLFFFAFLFFLFNSPFHGPVVAQFHDAVARVDEEAADLFRDVAGDGSDGLDRGDRLMRGG